MRVLSTLVITSEVHKGSSLPVPSLAKTCLVSLGLLFITPAVVEAQVGTPSWRQGGCSDKGCQYFKVIRRDYPFVLAKAKDTFPGLGLKTYHVKDEEKEFNCDAWKYRTRVYYSRHNGPYKWGAWDNWTDILPGTVAEANLRAVCR